MLSDYKKVKFIDTNNYKKVKFIDVMLKGRFFDIMLSLVKYFLTKESHYPKYLLTQLLNSKIEIV